LTAGRILECLVGLALVAWILADIFLSVILPRAAATRWRLSAQVSRRVWRLWRWYALRISDELRRENFMGAYAPLILVVFLILWVGMLVVGFGFILYGLRGELRPEPETLGDALYFAGTSLLTIGYGDIVPARGMARVVAVLAGASGFAVVAVVTSFLFQIFAAFQAREVFVVVLGSRAGAPPSGVTLLETYGELGARNELDSVFKDGEIWVASLLNTHIAYPVLAYFRSEHDYESWIGALGTLLDASTLVLTVVENLPRAQATFTNDLCRHATHDLSDYFGLEEVRDVGVERQEFETARDRLRAAGYVVREGDAPWEHFAGVRRTYAGPLNAMARFWRVPPAQWIGDRSLLAEHAALTADPSVPELTKA
jgi:hypothetical protein